MIEPDYKARGLHTDANPSASVPQGALLEASNVVIRRTDQVEPRPGFKAYTLTTPPTHDPRKLLPFGADMLIVASGDPSARWRSDTSAAVTDPDSAELTWSANRVRAQEVRKNLYLNASNGVHKITAAGGTSALRSGSVGAPTITWVSAASGSAYVDTKLHALRATIERKDANDLITTSPPSGRFVYENNSGANADVTWRVYVTAAALAGDTVRLYRSAASAAGVFPNDELDEVSTHDLVAADISAGYVDLVDALAETDRGRALYTSPSREGQSRENSAPPECKDLALFKNSLFCLNYLGPQQVVLTMDTDEDVSSSATGVGYRDFTGTRTNGSADITGSTPTTGVQVGMMLASSTNWSASPVVITGIAGGTWTMSATWNGSTDGAPASLTMYDTVRIGSNYHGIPAILTTVVSINAGHTATGTSAETGAHARAIGDAVHYKQTGATQAVDRSALLIQEIKRGGAAFVVYATHGDEYFPAVPKPDATGQNSEADDRDNGLWWSKSDQPEHFPLTNRARVGPQSNALLRGIVARDTLWLFTDNGVYTVKGYGERSGFRVDEFDLSLRLLVPECAVEYEGDVYAWTNEGFVKISPAGVEKISKLAIGNLLQSIETALAGGNITTAGAFMVANPDKDEIILGVPAAAGDSQSDKLYVYNVKTGAWVTWESKAYSCGALDPSDGLLYFADYNDYELDQERNAGDETDVADYEYAITIQGISGNVVTIAAASGWTPAVGDYFTQAAAASDSGNFEETIVTAITSATVFTVESVAGMAVQNGGTGAATAYVAYQSCIEWAPRSAKARHTEKRYRDAIFAFDEAMGLYRWVASFTSNNSESGTNQTHTESDTAYDPSTAIGAMDRRAYVDRVHARSTGIRPKLCMNNAASRWRVTGVAMDFEPTSTRVSR